ncbi:hypothetical protein SLA2020_102730 [Shorea laevis]
MPPFRRFFRTSQDFKFDFPSSPSLLTIVHADQLFSNGYLMYLFIDPSKIEIEACEDSDSNSALPTSSHPPKFVLPATKLKCSSLRKCRKMSKQLFLKYLDFLRPLYQRIRGCKPGDRAKGVDARVKVMKNWVYSVETSPQISLAYSVDNWRKSCDSESSIYEAVLHCRRSIGMLIFSYSSLLLLFALERFWF